MPSINRTRRSTSAAGRSHHVVDRALEYAALHAEGLRAAEIARRRRKSKGHVSILLRLGQAIRSCAPDEVEAFRSPRITWKLVQRLVRTSVSEVALRQQLRLALGGFSSHTVDRRRLRRKRGTDGAEMVRRSPNTFIWELDPGWAARDPVGYAEAYLAFLARLHRGVTTRIREVAVPPGVVHASPLVGQSLRQLSRRIQASPPTPTSALSGNTDGKESERRRALAILASIDGLLRRPTVVADDDVEETL